MQVRVNHDMEAYIASGEELTVLLRGKVQADGELIVERSEVVQGEGAAGFSAEELSGSRRESELGPVAAGEEFPEVEG